MSSDAVQPQVQVASNAVTRLLGKDTDEMCHMALGVPAKPGGTDDESAQPSALVSNLGKTTKEIAASASTDQRKMLVDGSSRIETEKELERKELRRREKKEKKERKEIRKAKKEAKRSKMFDHRKLLKEGQKHLTPPVADATRAFYESLYIENPDSKIAIRYLVEYGIFPIEDHKKLLRRFQALSEKGAYDARVALARKLEETHPSRGKGHKSHRKA